MTRVFHLVKDHSKVLPSQTRHHFLKDQLLPLVKIDGNIISSIFKSLSRSFGSQWSLGNQWKCILLLQRMGVVIGFHQVGSGMLDIIQEVLINKKNVPLPRGKLTFIQLSLEFDIILHIKTKYVCTDLLCNRFSRKLWHFI